MKWLAVFVGLLLLVAGVHGLSLTFQDPQDFTDITPAATGSGHSVWFDRSIGQNSYVRCIDGAFPSDTYIYNTVPLQTTYAAATVSASVGVIILMDSAHVQLYRTTFSSGRIEMYMVGGQAKVYNNGVLVSTSGVLATNPSYVGFGSANFNTEADVDDYILGTSDSPYIYGMPEQNAWILKKDLINPATSGFASSNGTIVNSNNMTITWGKNNGNNDTLYFASTDTGQVIATTYTGTAYAGSWDIPLAQLFNNATAPYGLYQVYSSGSPTRSVSIQYIATGASVAFNSHQYSQSDTATITYSVSAGYWLPSTYNYKMEIMDVYGNVVNSQTVTTQTGTKTYQWTSSNSIGVYYAALIATPTAGGSDIWMNFDYTNLNAYINFQGYVMNAETGAVLSGASVNVTQLTSYQNQTSLVDGSWNSSNSWLTGSTIYINTSKLGFTTDTNSFTPLSSKTVNLNISLIPSPATYSGVSIGGIVRDNVYGSTIPSATVSVQNAGLSQYFTSPTNIAGYYRVDSLTNGTVYNVWSAKTGFGNSTVALVTAVGI